MVGGSFLPEVVGLELAERGLFTGLAVERFCFRVAIDGLGGVGELMGGFIDCFRAMAEGLGDGGGLVPVFDTLFTGPLDISFKPDPVTADWRLLFLIWRYCISIWFFSWFMFYMVQE